MRAKLDSYRLDKHVDFYLEHALATSTRRTYHSAKRRYVSFCNYCHIPPLPTCEKIMCRYVDFLANEGLSHVTIKGYLAAVRHLHIENDAGEELVLCQNWN